MPTYDRIRKRSSTNRRLDDSTHRKKTFLKVTVKKETAQFHLKDVSTEEWKKVGPQKNVYTLRRVYWKFYRDSSA